jgi:DNA-directed RNA polymerase specialized sigma subunit
MDADSPLPADVADCLARLAAGDLTARDRILELCSDRVRHLAHRMLARFPNVRRWDDTDDVFQAAAMRLHRTLGQLPIDSPRAVLALAATEVRRELKGIERILNVKVRDVQQGPWIRAQAPKGGARGKPSARRSAEPCVGAPTVDDKAGRP